MQHWMEVRVSKRNQEATDIVALELVDPLGLPLPPFTAGAHIDVRVPRGLIRQYSLCNDPEERNRYLIAVLKEPLSRGGSAYLHDTLQEGELIRISEPRNHFELDQESAPCLLFAGGIGITPLLCMAERLVRVNRAFELHYCVRSTDRIAFQERLRGPSLDGRVRIHADDGPEDQKVDFTGCLQHFRPGTPVYVCGPAGFIDRVLQAARELGWGEDALHRECFAAPEQDQEAGGPFTVRIASSGEEYSIPAGKTVAEALAEAGIELPLSCEQGTCGSCLTTVLEGVPDHRDCFLTDAEQARNDCFLPCVSRARTTLLVLDL